MIYRKKSDLVRSQQSIFYFSGMIDDDQLRNRPQYDRKLYTSMLIEDVSMSLIPINTRAKGFRVFLTPSDSKIEELIAAAITRSSYERDLAEAVYDFFKQCSRTIMAFGERPYTRSCIFLNQIIKRLSDLN